MLSENKSKKDVNVNSDVLKINEQLKLFSIKLFEKYRLDVLSNFYHNVKTNNRQIEVSVDPDGTNDYDRTDDIRFTAMRLDIYLNPSKTVSTYNSNGDVVKNWSVERTYYLGEYGFGYLKDSDSNLIDKENN